MSVAPGTVSVGILSWQDQAEHLGGSGVLSTVPQDSNSRADDQKPQKQQLGTRSEGGYL